MRPSLLELFRGYSKRNYSAGNAIGLSIPIAPNPPKKKIPHTDISKRKFLFKKQGGKCAYCEVAFTQEITPTFDHIKPKSKGGGNNLENLVLACSQCNQLKGNMHSYAEAKMRSNRYLAFAKMLQEKGYFE